jgi:hypothetical protein
MNTSQNNSAQNSEQINTQAQSEQPTPNYNLVFFIVCEKNKVENCTYTDFISPYFETVEQARDFKLQAIAQHPECFIQESTCYFNSELDGNRQELLAKIVPDHSTSSSSITVEPVNLQRQFKPKTPIIKPGEIIAQDEFFGLNVNSDIFTPRVKRGQTLIMRRGCLAEDGDIVAVSKQLDDTGLGEMVRFELYRDGLEYYAVCVSIGTNLLRSA